MGCDSGHVCDRGNGQGIYLFCFARPGASSAIAEARLEETFSITELPLKDVVAVISEVSLPMWTGPEGERNLEDLSWVGPRAFLHEKVVEQAMRQSPVFPARFGAIFSSVEKLERLMTRHYAAISGFLDYTEDKGEWAVKVLLDREKAQEERAREIIADRQELLSALRPGARYFQEQRIRSEVNQELNRWLVEACDKVAEELGRHASDFCRRKPLSRAAAGANMDMLLNWAFLVPNTGLSDFLARIGEANAAHEAHGLLFQASGPWPPYSFTPALDGEDPP